MKNKTPRHTISGPVKQKSKILFQIVLLVLQNPKAVLDEKTEKELRRAVTRWTARSASADPAGLTTNQSSGPEKLMTKLKNMRRSLIRRETEKMPLWIERSGIRRSWPELPEYRIRRLAIRGLLSAFRFAHSIADFHRRASFSVKQILWKTASNSPHSCCFRINLKTGKATCTPGSGRMF